jgi:hypothetical protein
MDQLAIQTIEGFLSVPLIAPAAIHDLDAKEIAVVLTRLDAEVDEAKKEVEDPWDEDADEELMERLEEVTRLIRAAIDSCEACLDSEPDPCDRCRGFKRWLRHE